VLLSESRLFCVDELASGHRRDDPHPTCVVGVLRRVCDGVCVRLYSRAMLAALPPYESPELVTQPLDSVLLQMKVCDVTSTACTCLVPDRFRYHDSVLLQMKVTSTARTALAARHVAWPMIWHTPVLEWPIVA
jgi:hypothetical protein